eukprot:TRINITY_DN5563_c0_g1_i1.p1 TRINITY_DN5563_c0_g1~~TRINITY_DN5563_c0_g1_i1.p1  ORF type:complete len:456 (+),score=110.78 TRINITY_DN5563_c0_g1_i1:217-1584(+)
MKRCGGAGALAAALLVASAPRPAAPEGCHLFGAYDADALWHHILMHPDRPWSYIDEHVGDEPEHTPYITQIALAAHKVTVGRGTVTGDPADGVHPQAVSALAADDDLHYIEAIWVMTADMAEDGGPAVIAFGVFTGTSAPELTFVVPTGVSTVYAYAACNKHGVFKSPYYTYVRQPLAAPARPPPAEAVTCPYLILGVAPGAATPVIKQAYKALVRQHHPDQSRTSDQKAMAVVNNAYNALMDPKLRAQVDERRDSFEVKNWVRERPPLRHDRIAGEVNYPCDPQECAADAVGADPADPRRCLQHETLRRTAEMRQRRGFKQAAAFPPIAAHVKHTPRLAVSAVGFATVTVGPPDAPHMQHASRNPRAIHYVSILYVVDQDGTTVAATLPSPLDPRVSLVFEVPAGTTRLTAYAYCNRHGLYAGDAVEVEATGSRGVVCGVAACAGHRRDGVALL